MPSVPPSFAGALLGLVLASACSEPRCASSARSVDGVCRTFEPDAGVEDAGGDGDDEPLMCSNIPCRDTETDLLTFDACCDAQLEDVCGVFLSSALGPLEGCFAKHRPGNPSQSCSVLLDQLDRPLDTLDPGDDGAFTFKLGEDVVALPGCCVATGECGVAFDEFTVGSASLAVGAGCVPLSRLDLTELGDDAPVTTSGFCVPQRETDDEACPPVLSFGGMNLCDDLANLGLPLVSCDASATTPLWVCAARSWPTVEGEPAEVNVDSCMEYLPEFVRGCGVGVDAPGCIPNVPDQVFGCVDVDVLAADAQASVLATVPEWACGCGEGAEGLTCIRHVSTMLCGSKQTEVDTKGTPSTSDDCIRGVHEFLVGCGEDGVPTADPPCLRHAPVLFGCLEWTRDSVPGFPSTECGCGDEVPGDGACIPNVPETFCGTDVP